ncbi:Trp family transcriptional regulator [Thermophilibacter immobilis]|uniref:Trp family transcriptional regulator n=1 Tax=Thermophilibacter immobilis TaxID=2779519 RepID=UPI002FC2F7D8
MPVTEHAGDGTQRLFSALCALSSSDEACRFLRDLCTPREIEDLSQRLEVATMLAGGGLLPRRLPCHGCLVDHGLACLQVSQRSGRRLSARARGPRRSLARALGHSSCPSPGGACDCCPAGGVRWSRQSRSEKTRGASCL